MIGKIDDLMTSIFINIHLNNMHPHVLSEIRNTFFPKLISGEIRVPISKKEVPEEVILT